MIELKSHEETWLTAVEYFLQGAREPQTMATILKRCPNPGVNERTLSRWLKKNNDRFTLLGKSWTVVDKGPTLTELINRIDEIQIAEEHQVDLDEVRKTIVDLVIDEPDYSSYHAGTFTPFPGWEEEIVHLVLHLDQVDGEERFARLFRDYQSTGNRIIEMKQQIMEGARGDVESILGPGWEMVDVVLADGDDTQEYRPRVQDGQTIVWRRKRVVLTGPLDDPDLKDLVLAYRSGRDKVLSDPRYTNLMTAQGMFKDLADEIREMPELEIIKLEDTCLDMFDLMEDDGEYDHPPTYVPGA